MKISSRLLLLLVFLPVPVLLSGCSNAADEEAAAAAENARLAAEWDPSWGPNPYLTNGSGNGTGTGEDGEEVIRDTAYVVKEKRQSGGELVQSGTSSFDGRPLYKRSPVESMIIVEGNRTGQRSAYLLPQSDYNVVQVGHALQESTLGRWESTSENHIPEETGTRTVRQRSRSGGTAENYVY